jgi:hypothetical protein
VKRFLFIAFLLFGCTTIGIHDDRLLESMDFAQVEPLRICILSEVDEERTEALKSEIKAEFARYNIEVSYPWTRRWERPCFEPLELLLRITEIPLEPPCDKLLAFVGRGGWDYLYGLFLLPEVFGAVDSATRTKGFAVAEIGSVNQLLSAATPKRAAVHEAHHMIGCDHGWSMGGCYNAIVRMKAIAHKNRIGGNDFWPGVSRKGKLYPDRRKVNERQKRAAKRIRKRTDRCEWREFYRNES